MADGEKRPHILVGVSGSVACVKLPALVKLLVDIGDVRIVYTRASREFRTATQNYDSTAYDEHIGRITSGQVLEYDDVDEWKDYTSVGTDPVLHIELRKWADVFLIAPLSANTLAKASHGLCDNLLTCILRAWDVTKPVIVAPAMNTAMWDHPLTSSQLDILKSFLKCTIIMPVSKTLACGDTGSGAMASIPSIVHVVTSKLSE